MAYPSYYGQPETRWQMIERVNRTRKFDHETVTANVKLALEKVKNRESVKETL